MVSRALVDDNSKAASRVAVNLIGELDSFFRAYSRGGIGITYFCPVECDAALS